MGGLGIEEVFITALLVVVQLSTRCATLGKRREASSIPRGVEESAPLRNLKQPSSARSALLSAGA